jgi:uncharacterized protein (UPF0264 family)
MTTSDLPPTGLLVSVRSAEEAVAALAGGADLIDVKEPSRGSLGRADDATIATVVRAVAGRRPVSAAFGDLLTDDVFAYQGTGLHYGKWGLKGWGKQPVHAWQGQFRQAVSRLHQCTPLCREVLVAYADYGRAASPAPEAVCAFANELGSGALLLDTFEKDGSTLLDWLSIPKIALFCRLSRNAGVPIALAGSLGREEITALRYLKPNWFAARGAACAGGNREGQVATRCVEELKALISAPVISSSGDAR